MPTGLHETATSTSLTLLPLLLSLSLSLSTSPAVSVRAAVAPSSSDRVTRGQSNPLGIDWNPAPSAEDGPPGAKDALRNPAYLPAQIGGIVGSYAFSLVLVALILLALSKKRRERLRAAEDFDLWEEPSFEVDFPEAAFRSRDELFDGGSYNPNPFQVSHELPSSPGHVRNFSLPSPTSPRFEIPRLETSKEAASPSSYILPSPTSTTRGPLGQDPIVDQGIVQRDRAMAQAQLEQMYKYVMEQEEAKEAGVDFKGPVLPSPAEKQQQQQQQDSSSGQKKGRNKPANLNLSKSEKTQSRTSSILSALKSPLGKKKQVQGISISSPIMTPMSGTFPQYVGEEMNAIPPRQYAPAKPPPVPTNQASFRDRRNTGQIAPLTPPDLSPESTQSIDERIGAIAIIKGKDRGMDRGEDISEEDTNQEEEDDNEEQQGGRHRENSYAHSRHISLATTEADPVSAVSETSQSPLIRNPGPRASGLPTSPKPGVNRFPSLPASPRPGATFSRPNAPTAVRTGGMLPLRAYESGLMSPNTYDRTVKQTVFERAPGPRSPGGMHTARTPLTGNPVPYSPYQPFSPVVPITPSLVTKADRKRMKRLEPKTPTLQMVKSDDELW